MYMSIYMYIDIYSNIVLIRVFRWLMASRPVLCRAEIPGADCRHLRCVAQVSLWAQGGKVAPHQRPRLLLVLI